MKHTKKFLALVLSLAVVASLAAAGTLAYLTGKTEQVTNTFAVGTQDKSGAIKLTLDEAPVNPETGKEIEGARVTENQYNNLLPGSQLDKDPTVHIDEKSEDCYLFIGIKNPNAEALAAQSVNEALTAENKVTTTTNGYDVYFIPAVQTAGTNVTVFDGVNVSTALNETTLAALEGAKIQVAAYAIQAANMESAAAALEAGTADATAFFAGL